MSWRCLGDALEMSMFFSHGWFGSKCLNNEEVELEVVSIEGDKASHGRQKRSKRSSRIIQVIGLLFFVFAKPGKNRWFCGNPSDLRNMM